MIFGFTLIAMVARKYIQNRRTRRYLKEERALIVEIRQALEIVERDLAPSSERSGSLDADMRTVNQLAAKIKATDGIHPFAINVADYVYNHTFRPQEPDASAGTVIGAKERCDRAFDGYDQLEQERTTAGRWLKHWVRHPNPSPKNTAVSGRKFRVLTGTGVRIPRGKHKAIADVEGTYSGDNTVPKAITSPKPEGESEMSGVSTLPEFAVGYQEKLALLKSQLGNLEDMPVLPRYITGDAIYQWRDHALDWTVETRRTLTLAVDLASIHERRTHRSGRLAQASDDAEVGLEGYARPDRSTGGVSGYQRISEAARDSHSRHRRYRRIRCGYVATASEQMLPASDDIPGSNDTSAGGSEKQRPPPSTPTFDPKLMAQLSICSRGTL